MVLEGLPDLAVMEGDTTVFECKISGEPLPSIKWSVLYIRLFAKNVFCMICYGMLTFWYFFDFISIIKFIFLNYTIQLVKLKVLSFV